jgi:hypothetical protein
LVDMGGDGWLAIAYPNPKYTGSSSLGRDHGTVAPVLITQSVVRHGKIRPSV